MIWVNEIIWRWIAQLDEEQWTRTIPSSFNSIQQTTLHLVSAEKIWLDFWQNVPNPTFLSQEFNGTKQELIAIWMKTSSRLRKFIDNHPEEDYAKPILFKVKSENWQLKFWQTFSHFINHATYHRGQLVTLLRQVGFTDFSSTDLATFYKKRLTKEKVVQPS
jgi:uncharacterized damage-inducible protein DinB